MMIRIYWKLLFRNDNNRSILRFCLLRMDFYFLFKSIFNVDYFSFMFIVLMLRDIFLLVLFTFYRQLRSASTQTELANSSNLECCANNLDLMKEQRHFVRYFQIDLAKLLFVSHKATNRKNVGFEKSSANKIYFPAACFVH